MVPSTPFLRGSLAHFKLTLFFLLLSNPKPSHFTSAAPAFSGISSSRPPAEIAPLWQMTAKSRWTMALITAMAVATLMAGSAEAQSTPPGSSGCTNALVSLYPCLAFVTGNGSFSRPAQGCCGGLATVVKTSAECLCQLIGSATNPFGIPINRTMALSLPRACNITTPPLSQCKAAGAPTSAPADAPASPAGSNPGGATAASHPGGRVSPGANSPTSSSAPTANISPTNSDKGNIPSASPRQISGVAAIFTPSMMMTSALVGMMMTTIINIGQ